MYKTLGFRWLFEVFYPASAFATTDRDEARNPQRFIHVTVVANGKITPLKFSPLSYQKSLSKLNRFVISSKCF